MENRIVTCVYIDGFNLYYGCLKDTPYRWINLEKLCQNIVGSNYQLSKINYFTAKIKRRQNENIDPIRRQALYLRALRTLNILEIIEGSFLNVTKKGYCKRTKKVESIITSEEKGSDVNLGTMLLSDAYLNNYNCAVVITNDSDLYLPINIVKNELKKEVIIINPHKKFSHKLASLKTKVREIRKSALEKSLFPDEIDDASGKIRNPYKS